MSEDSLLSVRSPCFRVVFIPTCFLDVGVWSPSAFSILTALFLFLVAKRKRPEIRNEMVPPFLKILMNDNEGRSA